MIINLNFYVALIEVEDFFRDLTNSEIPGVIYVSAENPEEEKIINVLSKIAESLLFGKDLERYLRYQNHHHKNSTEGKHFNYYMK